MNLYELTLILAGLLVTVGIGGLAYNLVANHPTPVRRPLTVVALIMGLILEVSYIDFLLLQVFGVNWIHGANQRVLTSTMFLVIGAFLVLKPYVNFKESQQRNELRGIIDSI